MKFQFRPVLSIVSLISLAILISLGVWQVQRLAWKEDLIARIEARTAAEPLSIFEAHERWAAGEDMEYTPVYAEIQYDHENEAHVFGTWDGDIGWYIFTPARMSSADGKVLYINRGFVPEAQKLPTERVEGQIAAAAEIRVVGLLRTPQEAPVIAGAIAPENNISGNEWHVRNPEIFAASTKYADLSVLPVWIDSSGAENSASWPLGGTTRVEFNNRHLEYALTWFGLAATLLVVFAAFSLRRD